MRSGSLVTLRPYSAIYTTFRAGLDVMQEAKPEVFDEERVLNEHMVASRRSECYEPRSQIPNRRNIILPGAV